MFEWCDLAALRKCCILGSLKLLSASCKTNTCWHLHDTNGAHRNCQWSRREIQFWGNTVFKMWSQRDSHEVLLWFEHWALQRAWHESVCRHDWRTHIFSCPVKHTETSYTKTKTSASLEAFSNRETNFYKNKQTSLAHASWGNHSKQSWTFEQQLCDFSMTDVWTFQQESHRCD